MLVVQGFGDGSVRLSALAVAALGSAGADNLSMRQLTLASHRAAVSALLDHRWQPQAAAVPLEVLVTGAFSPTQTGIARA